MGEIVASDKLRRMTGKQASNMLIQGVIDLMIQYAPGRQTMTADELRRATGYLSSHYRISTTKTRHWAFAEVLECDPLTHGGAIVRIGNTDNGRHGWHSCGPRDLVIGAHVELFEFYIFGQWTMDFRVLREDE